MTKRCAWADGDSLYESYHDTEWGVPVYDDRLIFEFLLLEGMQAGLSWLTILKKRENFRRAFSGFDYEQIARYNRLSIERLLGDAGIIRNNLKVNSAVTNARAFLAVRDEFGSFSRYIWGFVDGRPVVNHWQSMADIPTETETARVISKDLKRRGFKFVGPTIVYSHMQAAGMVNDHLVDCPRHAAVQKLARNVK